MSLADKEQIIHKTKCSLVIKTHVHNTGCVWRVERGWLAPPHCTEPSRMHALHFMASRRSEGFLSRGTPGSLAISFFPRACASQTAVMLQQQERSSFIASRQKQHPIYVVPSTVQHIARSAFLFAEPHVRHVRFSLSVLDCILARNSIVCFCPPSKTLAGNYVRGRCVTRERATPLLPSFSGGNSCLVLQDTTRRRRNKMVHNRQEETKTRIIRPQHMN